MICVVCRAQCVQLKLKLVRKLLLVKSCITQKYPISPPSQSNLLVSMWRKFLLKAILKQGLEGQTFFLLFFNEQLIMMNNDGLTDTLNIMNVAMT